MGLGVDIIEVARVDFAISRWGDRFLKRVFTDKELSYAFGRKCPTEHLAVRFAAKEAFFKAFSGKGNISWKNIEVVNEADGKPRLRLYGKLKELKNEKKINNILLSVSHTKEHAVACCFLT